MLILTNQLAQEFMKHHPGISVYVDGGGTKTGIDALVQGTIDICAASRLLKPEEIKLLSDEFRSIGVSTLIAKDALSIYINKSNSITDFTLEDVKNIFTCRIKNWQSLGGVEHPIKVITRSPNSGTYLYFKEHVLNGEEYCQDAIIKTSTQEIVAAVSGDPYSIGYGGVGYGKNVLHASINGVIPTEENVRNDSYPIIRYLFFVTRDNPKDASKIFLDWVLSQEGQKVVREASYISLWER